MFSAVVMVDLKKRYADWKQQVHLNCRTMIFHGDVHDQPFIDRILYMRTGKQCAAIISWLSTLEIPGFESDRPMRFNSNVSTNSYRSLASHQREPNRLRKVQMNASVMPMESPDEIPEGKLEHMVHSPHSHLPASYLFNGRMPQDNGVHIHSHGVDTGDNFIDAANIAAEDDTAEDPPELRDNRVNWQHPPTMDVLHARHRQNSDPKPTTPADFARLHREENERYAREWREKQAERQREAEDKKRAERRQRKADERANRPARHQLREQVSGERQPTMNGHAHNFSYGQNEIDPRQIPMPDSPPRSGDSLSKPLPLNPQQRQLTPPQVEMIPALQHAQQINLRENTDSFNDPQQYGHQHYDLSTLGGQLTPQHSYRSTHSRESAKSHPSPRSPQFRPGTANSIKSDEYGREPLSPLERNETPEVHEARIEQLVKAQHGNARVWHDLDHTSGSHGSHGKRF